MKARRITYLALLAVAALLHFAYGQYVTNYMLLFLLLTPVLSVLLSLPAALTARAELVGGGDVCRGRPSRVRLTVMCRGFIPPEAWHIKLKAHNLFTGGDMNPQKVSLGSEWDTEREFTVDTFDIGCVRWQIAHAWIFDYLGIRERDRVPGQGQARCGTGPCGEIRPRAEAKAPGLFGGARAEDL